MEEGAKGKTDQEDQTPMANPWPQNVIDSQGSFPLQLGCGTDHDDDKVAGGTGDEKWTKWSKI